MRGEALADLLTSKLLSNNSNGAPSTPTTPLPSKEQIFSWVPDEDFSKALLKLEADQLEIAYKIGVLYVKNGQVREDEMFGNGTLQRELDAHQTNTVFLFSGNLPGI